MLRNKLLVILLTFLSTSASFGQDSLWSYSQCVEFAIENNLYVKLQDYEVGDRTEEYKQARSQRYPSVSGFYSHSFNRGLNPDPTTNVYSQQSVNTGSFGAQVGVPIFNGRKISNTIKQTRNNIESAEFGKEKIENDIIIQVTENYLDVIYKFENVDISKKRVKTLQEQVDRTKRLVEAGSSPLSELLDLMSQFADTERQLTESENAYNIAVLTLKQSMQLDFSTSFSVDIPDFADPDTTMQFTPSEVVFDESKLIMPEIKQAELNITVTEFQEKIAKGDYYPSLNFNGNINTRYSSNYVNPIDPNDTSLGTQFENFFSQVATIQLNIPIYSRRNVKTAVNKARLSTKKNEVQLQQQLNDLRKKIEQSYINALSSQKTYISNKKSVESLQEQFRSVNKRFASGAASTTDYVVAENNLNIAKAELNRSKYQFIFSRKILDFYSGKQIILE
ncbi:TolC family protein [Flammeovirga kamogawensis]|uniref:TolC family protein n=1 Tax=Flammeovirga kamogawensis TaxID=373891 RepID=A0ABX8GX88_9BACT|nr:TolC family protein [Flammeovirga kamogawensis]MBB6460658.1 outer membrane protein [Flammeovirga kamogawensis]QWG08013.1 TolC family protein [Flammeovirga kamogawensis]TRX69820.1 TolC family protein [Flammeovirga kamogawensis]